jgi:hypothetical protein
MSIQYRIKMTIAADTSFYLDSAIINYIPNCNTGNVAEKISIHPNPVTENLFVTIERNTPANTAIEMYTTTGQKVYSLYNQPVNGEQTFTIPVKQLSPGVYVVAVFINDKKVTTKKVIIR